VTGTVGEGKGKRGPRWGEKIYGSLDRRLGLRLAVIRITSWRVPPQVNMTHCFGGLAFFLFLIQMMSGIFLAVYYKGSPDQAYASVRFIMTEVSLGWLVRGVHRWAGEGLILLMGLHVLRVFLSGAFKNPRELNWVVGVLISFLIVGFRFTGQLLPWDQRAFWSTVSGIEVVKSVPLAGHFLLALLWGGETLDGMTLGRFYTAHVLVLPWMAFGLILLHFLIVRKQGIARSL
jgi:quinol-cytochrome oxidoreductase complex cytochrome b subunit